MSRVSNLQPAEEIHQAHGLFANLRIVWQIKLVELECRSGLELKAKYYFLMFLKVFWLKTMKSKKIITYQCFAALIPDPYGA